MKKLLLSLVLAFGLLSPAWAVNSGTFIGDVSYSATITDTTIYTTAAFTAGRTITLPAAGGTCIGQNCAPPASQLEINDIAGAYSQAFPLTITPQSGETIDGNTGSLVISGARSRVVLFPTSGTNWSYQTQGDYVTTGVCPAPASAATVTITIAAPGVITDTAHGITGACPVVFTNSGGGLPTGITSGTTYWVVPSSITTNTFTIATSVANALAGTAVTTTGTSTGTQTATPGSTLASTTAANVTGLTLSQGQFDCRAKVARTLGASTSVTKITGSISGTSATAATQGGNSMTVLSTAANVMGAGGTDSTISLDREAVTTGTNIFLVAQDTFSVSTNVAYGNITCRRVR